MHRRLLNLLIIVVFFVGLSLICLGGLNVAHGDSSSSFVFHPGDEVIKTIDGVYIGKKLDVLDGFATLQEVRHPEGITYVAVPINRVEIMFKVQQK